MSASGDSMGAALAYHRAYSNTWDMGALWMNLLDFNLYGDPSLSLASSGDPC